MKEKHKMKNIFKYLQLMVFTCLTLLAKTQTTNDPTITCGKLNMTWNDAGNTTYDIQIFKNGNTTPYASFTTSINGVKSATFLPNSNEVLETGYYQFKVKRNPTGNPWSSLSNPISTSLSYNALSPSVSNICANSITLNWNRLINGASCNTNITYKYYIERYTDNSGLMLYTGFTTFTGTTTNNSFTFRGTEPNSFYKIRVEALGNNGTASVAINSSVFPATGCIQTAALPAVSNIAFSNITCGGFNISWNAFTGVCAPSNLIYRYSIYNTNEVVSDLINPIFVGTTTSTSVTYSNVNPSNNYKVKVEVLENFTNKLFASSSFPSGVGAIQTLNIPAVPSITIGNIATTPTSNWCTAITTTWPKVDCATEYVIQVMDYSANPTNGLISNTITVAATTASIQTTTIASGIKANNFYVLRIRAIKKVNNIEVATSTVTSSTSLQTPNIIAPTTPISVTVCGRNVTITWGASTDVRAEGYLVDLSNSGIFAAGNFISLTSQDPPIENFSISGRTNNSFTFTMPSIHPFVQRTIYFRVCAKNVNLTCNSGYGAVSINISETAASIDYPISTISNSPIEVINNVPNNFKTYYLGLGSVYPLNFEKHGCVQKCQVKVEMASADGNVYSPNGVASSATTWSGPQTTNLTNFLSGFFSDYIKNNGGTLCNYNGIGTFANLNAASTSLLLAPEIKCGNQVLSTGYHKITLLYWTGGNPNPESQSIIVRVFNVLNDFSLQYPDQSGNGSFTNYYFNTASPLCDIGPGFNCLTFGATINAKSNTPNFNPFSFGPTQGFTIFMGIKINMIMFSIKVLN